MAVRFPTVIERTERIATRSTQRSPRTASHVPAAAITPVASKNVTFRNRISIANPPAFDATARNAVIVIGAPSYTSGAQKWNGTAEIL